MHHWGDVVVSHTATHSISYAFAIAGRSAFDPRSAVRTPFRSTLMKLSLFKWEFGCSCRRSGLKAQAVIIKAHTQEPKRTTGPPYVVRPKPSLCRSNIPERTSGWSSASQGYHHQLFLTQYNTWQIICQGIMWDNYKHKQKGHNVKNTYEHRVQKQTL